MFSDFQNTNLTLYGVQHKKQCNTCIICKRYPKQGANSISAIKKVLGCITHEPFHSSAHLMYMVSRGSVKDGIILETLLCVPRMNFPFHTEFVLLLLLFNYMLYKM